MKVLISGFEPFGGMPVNPSQVLVNNIDKIKFNTNQQLEFLKLILPVDFEQAGKIIKDVLLKEKPDVLISTGVDFMKKNIELELLAHKNEFYILPEFLTANQNSVITIEKLPKDYQTKIDIHTIQQILSSKGCNTIVSDDTGMYVCNHVYYIAQLTCELYKLKTKPLFVHIPYTYPYFVDEDKITPLITIKEVLKTFGYLIAEIIKMETNISEAII